MPFDDIVIAGYGEAKQTLPLGSGEQAKSTLDLVNESIQVALSKAEIDRHQVDGLITHRPPSADHVLQFNQKILADMKIAPTSTTAVTNHGAGMLSAFKYAALLLERGLATHVLLPSGDAGALWIHDEVKQNANLEADRHFEAPYNPITPSLYAQIGQRYMYERKVPEEALARIAVEGRKWALHHPEAAMRRKGPLSIADVLASPMIASPSRLLHCAPYYPGGRAGSIILSRASDAPGGGEGLIRVASVGECVTHEYISDKMGLFGSGPWTSGPNLTTTGAAVAAQQAYDFAGFGPDAIDVAQTPTPFAFALLMILEELQFCEPGGVVDWVMDGGVDFEDGLPFNTNGGSLSFGQSHLNCPMDAVMTVLQQLDGTFPGKNVPHARRGLVHSHGGVLAAHTVALFEKPSA